MKTKIIIAALVVFAVLCGAGIAATPAIAPVQSATPSATLTLAPTATPAPELTAVPTASPTPYTLEGKTCLLLGDSITNRGKYVPYLRDLTGMEVINGGFGGATLSKTKSEIAPYYCLPRVVDALASGEWAMQERDRGKKDDWDRSLDALEALDVAAVDTVIIFYGTNDLARGCRLGEAGSTDVTTIRGAMNYAVGKLREMRPGIDIMFITPMPRFDDMVEKYGEGFLEYGVTLQMIRDAIIAGAVENDCRVLDMRDCGITEDNHSRYFEDGIHPTDAGGKLIGGIIADALRRQ